MSTVHLSAILLNKRTDRGMYGFSHMIEDLYGWLQFYGSIFLLYYFPWFLFSLIRAVHL